MITWGHEWFSFGNLLEENWVIFSNNEINIEFTCGNSDQFSKKKWCK